MQGKSNDQGRNFMLQYYFISYLSTSFTIWPKTMFHRSYIVPQSHTQALICSGLVRCLMEQVLTAMETKYSGALFPWFHFTAILWYIVSNTA